MQSTTLSHWHTTHCHGNVSRQAAPFDDWTTKSEHTRKLSASLWTQTRVSEEKNFLQTINTHYSWHCSWPWQHPELIAATIMWTRTRMDHSTPHKVVSSNQSHYSSSYSPQTLSAEPHCCHDYVCIHLLGLTGPQTKLTLPRVVVDRITSSSSHLL